MTQWKVRILNGKKTKYINPISQIRTNVKTKYEMSTYEAQL